MSSNILSKPIDVKKFGVIYAGTQKNMGPSGMAIVIIRKDLVTMAHPMTPTLYQYKTHADSHSMYHTPPTYTWYMVGLVLQWLKAQGGLAEIAKINAEKARRLYAAIDTSDFYTNTIATPYRSRMNVVFRLVDETLEPLFLAQSQRAGLLALKGHRAVGGMRASLYNALPIAGVDALIDFMRAFEKAHG
jgi:phosphoserine aminotransferase